MLYELIFPVGIVAASVAGVWVVPHLGWQFMFVIGAAPAVLVLFLRRALPESPRWLAGRGRLEAAEAAIGRIERETQKAMGGKALPPVQPGRKLESRRAALSDLFGSLYLRRTLVVWVIWFASYLVNYGLSIWMPTVYRTVFKLPLGVSLQYGMITTAFGLVGAAIAAFLIDSIGRKPLFAVSFVGSAAALLVLAMIAHPTAQQVLIYITIAYFFVSAINLGVYLYTPELYPDSRSRARRWDSDRVASAGLDDRSDRRRIYDRIRPPVGVHIFRVSVLCSRAGHCVVCDRNETTGTRGSVALNKSGLGVQTPIRRRITVAPAGSRLVPASGKRLRRGWRRARRLGARSARHKACRC